jgi:hypothetical protein
MQIEEHLQLIFPATNVQTNYNAAWQHQQCMQEQALCILAKQEREQEE